MNNLRIKDKQQILWFSDALYKLKEDGGSAEKI